MKLRTRRVLIIVAALLVLVAAIVAVQWVTNVALGGVPTLVRFLAGFVVGQSVAIGGILAWAKWAVA